LQRELAVKQLSGKRGAHHLIGAGAAATSLNVYFAAIAAYN